MKTQNNTVKKLQAWCNPMAAIHTHCTTFNLLKGIYVEVWNILQQRYAIHSAKIKPL